MTIPMEIAFFGSSVTSSYWNGAATYYRGLTRALAALGHRVRFFEPDALGRQQHRDLEPPDWLDSVIYPAERDADARAALRDAMSTDVLVHCGGVGVFDALLARETPALRSASRRVVFLDVDAPATLSRVRADPDDPLRDAIPRYDAVLTYGGGAPVITAYTALGARRCVPIYNAADPEVHHPAPPDPRFAALLSFLGNRLPDREARVGEFFLDVASSMPRERFVIGGSGWSDAALPPNVRDVGHVYVHEHNAFNASARAVLNISRESMASTGFSPATRVFEAAAAGACLITDAWDGIEQFLEPGREVLVASSGDGVASILRDLTPEDAAAIGAAARARVLADHTYEDRAHRFLHAVGATRRPRRAEAVRP